MSKGLTVNPVLDKYRGKIVEYHIIQSFPVTCLNRDDVGAPKSAEIGGVTRARVSSQCWKRSVRMSLRDLGIRLGTRTKYIKDILRDKMMALGATEEQAEECGEAFIKVSKSPFSKDTLHFFTQSEAEALAEYAKSLEFNSSSFDGKDITKVHKESLKINNSKELEGLDIALFGRMAANAKSLNVESAASFAHAISTHRIANELDFFTALDDSKEEEGEQGSGHMGILEYNSATYYRYISLNLWQLVETLGGDEDLEKAVMAFTQALYRAVPEARQATMSGASSWDYASILIRKGHRIQLSFEKPIKPGREGGYADESIKALKEKLDTLETRSGSLYNKIAHIRFGDGGTDDTIDYVSKEIARIAVEEG